MRNLIAVAFRVQNYRNIEDSGWIPLERVTALVGRNESGKTALLKALHKFNPATKEPYFAQKEFPRARYTTDYLGTKKDWPVCSVRFCPSDSFVEEIKLLVGVVVEGIVCTRYYSGKLSIEATPSVEDAPITLTNLLAVFKTFSKAVRKIAATETVTEEETVKLREDLLAWYEVSVSALKACNDFRDPSGLDIITKIKRECNTHSKPQTADAIEPVVEALDVLNSEARKPRSGEQFDELVKSAIPVFVYFDNYGILDSAINLSRFNEDKNRNPSDPRVRTIDALFKHTGLDATDIEQLGTESAHVARPNNNDINAAIIRDQERKDSRQIKLNAASNVITNNFSEWWHQRRHTIEYLADGNYFRVWISDDRRPGVKIELESRSKGFQWFFSFYLVFLVESEEGHKDAMLLLDEPGTHLHPTAQQELIAFFEELSEKNQIVYSTHSPFLIDGENIQRVRPVTEDLKGESHVTIGGWPKDRDTIFPLWAAAGYALMAGLLQQAKSVLVEGVSDYLYLIAASRYCRIAGKPCLPEDVSLTPCGGVTKMGPLAALFLGGKVRPIILLDGDSAGRAKVKELSKELYKDHERAILLVSEILGISGAEIEDFLGEDIILSALNQLLTKPITLIEKDRTAQESVVTHIEVAARRLAIELPKGWKADCAYSLTAAWAKKDCDAITEDALDRFARLFSAINERFSGSSLMKIT